MNQDYISTKKNVWKIGSRWDTKGNPNKTILDLFFENQMVFFGDNQNHTTDHIMEYKDKIDVDDYFAIADGLSIIAVAKVLQTGNYIENIQNLNIDTFLAKPDDVFDYYHETGSKNAFGWKVEIRKPINDIIVQRNIKVGRQRIYRMRKYAKDIIDIFNNYSV